MEILPLKDNVFVHNLEKGERKVGSIILPDDDGKVYGVHPRWAQVYSVGPDVTDLKPGEWVLVQHGRWTRTITIRDGDQELKVWAIELSSILGASDEPFEIAYNTDSEFTAKTINHKYLM